MTILIKNRSMMVQKRLKKDMKNNFTVKLSKHKHADELCIRTVTFDDNWKIVRSKCYYDQMTIETEKLEPIQLGCTQKF